MYLFNRDSFGASASFSFKRWPGIPTHQSARSIDTGACNKHSGLLGQVLHFPGLLDKDVAESSRLHGKHFKCEGDVDGLKVRESSRSVEAGPGVGAVHAP